MRLLEYKQELFGNGYTVVGADVYYDDIPSQDCEKCLPIKMTFLSNFFGLRTPTPEALAEILTTFIHVDWGENEKRFFYTNYEDIIKGKYPEWKLVAFRVMPDCIQLHFFNPKSKGFGENEDYGYLLLCGEDCGLNVKFEVPRVDGGPETKYLVSASREQTKVIEYANHVRREIEFFFKNPDKTNPFVDDQYIEVAEYADL